MSNRTFYVFSFGFGLGIFISSFFKLGFSFFLFLFLLAGLIFAFGKFLAEEKGLIIFLALFIFSFGLGVLRYEIKEIKIPNDKLSNLVGQKVVLIGTVMAEPAVKDQSVQLIVATETEQKILVTAGLFPEFKYGDLIEIEGKLETPENFETATGRDFDYSGFLAKEDIYYQISFANPKIISRGHGSFIKSKLFGLKNAFSNKINSLIKEPESALLNGLLLGAKNSLGKDLQADFRTAGVSHIVALSGYNITIVAVGIMSVLTFLPRAASLAFGVLGLIAFAIMTGGSATVVRASLMALLVLLAKYTNRKYDITRALLLAGVLMLIQNPKILVFDISFQLSFLSTLALILVSPLVEKKVTFIPEKYKLREIVVATLATQIFVLPFLIYKMGLISVFGLVTNVLILPFIPLIMFLGFLAGIAAFIFTPLAVLFAFFCSGLLSYLLLVIHFFSHLPLAAITLKSFPLFLVSLVYLFYFWFMIRNKSIIFKTDETY